MGNSDLGQLEWLFLDLGGTVIDDTIWKEYLDGLLIETMRSVGIGVTNDELASARARARNNKVNRPTVAALYEFTGDETEAVKLFGEAYERLRGYYDNGVEIPDFLTPNAQKGLTRLGGKFRLATLSNNISKVRYLLDITGVADYFKEHFISEEIGAAKPDEAIFRVALNNTGIKPNQGLMVGDRLDNDIIPARRLGMTTALIYSRTDKVIEDNADIVCEDLMELADILKTDK